MIINHCLIRNCFCDFALIFPKLRCLIDFTSLLIENGSSNLRGQKPPVKNLKLKFSYNLYHRHRVLLAMSTHLYPGIRKHN